MKRRIYKPLCIALALAAVPLAWSASTGPASPPAGAPAMSRAEAQDPVAVALRLYNEGVKLAQRADQAGTDAKKAPKGLRQRA